MIRNRTIGSIVIRNAMRISACLFFMMLASGGFFSTPAHAKRVSPEMDDDPVLQAMRAEMERSKTQLKMEQMAAPYYIEYRVSDSDVYQADAAFGAIRSDFRNRFRTLTVVVRVGDYQQDSSLAPIVPPPGSSPIQGGGTGVTQSMSIDDNIVSLRRELWLATDQAYKQALEAFTAKKAQLKQYAADQSIADFARAEPVNMVLPRAKLEIDVQPFLKMIRAATAAYQRDAAVDFLEANAIFTATNRYLVNSEGATVRNGQALYEMDISSQSQAADGMNLRRVYQYSVLEKRELPTESEFVAQAVKLIASFKDMKAAPVVDDEYHGPVLLSASAASSVVSALIGENLLGRRPGLGQNARTLGAWASNYKTRVLPTFLSVVDDPTISSFKGKEVIGGYPVDEEGVKADRVSLIENGKLVNYLMSRTPIRDFPASNGHGRTPGAYLGNLIVNAEQAVAPEELKKRLIALCKERGLAYGYYVEAFGEQLRPALLRKIWVNDGHEELVRGAVFGNLDTRSLRDNLVAAGDDMFVQNVRRTAPHSVVAPSFLFDELEVKKEDTKNLKLPDYPIPPLQAK